jgi:hypothetical protein
VVGGATPIGRRPFLSVRSRNARSGSRTIALVTSKNTANPDGVVLQQQINALQGRWSRPGAMCRGTSREAPRQFVRRG